MNLSPSDTMVIWFNYWLYWFIKFSSKFWIFFSI